MDGEGCFQFRAAVTKNRNSSYVATNPTFHISQSNHDVAVLEAIKVFFGAGVIKPKFDTNDINASLNSRSVSRFVIQQEDIVIAFVDKYPMFTSKQLDYLDWKQLVEMKSAKVHSTKEGLALMQKIKSGINNGRKK